MADDVYITVPKRVLEDLHREATRIMRPKATYNPNTETYLKSVIAVQTDRAVIITNMVNDILEGKHL